MKSEGILSIGEIIGVHGLDGTLKVRSFAESDDIFAPGRRMLVRRPGGPGDAGPIREITIENARPHKGLLLLNLSGVSGRDAAEAMRGSFFCIERSALPEPEAGTYYWADLIGLRVCGMDGAAIGRLTAIMATGSNDVYVVREGASETLVPAIASVVREIDLAAGVMRVEMPEGL